MKWQEGDLGKVDTIRLGVCVNDSGGNPAQCTVATDGAVSGDVQVNGGLVPIM